MKKKIIILFLIVAALSLYGCSSGGQTEASTPAAEPQETEPQEEQAEPEEEQPEEEPEQIQDESYSIGDTWTVDGQWSITIDGISITEDRNEFSDKDPAQVFVIDYNYENIGYEDEDGIMDGLYFDLSSDQIVDSEGFMGYSYPGDIVDYPQEVPTGAKCKAQACIGVDNESSEIKIIVSKYDGTGTEHEATFVIPVE